MAPQENNSAQEIARLVAMAELLHALGFAVNDRSRRCACVLHGGGNVSAFAWREDGRWKCYSCGRGGDRIALVRAARQCSFRDAVSFLAQLAGVTYSPRRLSRREIERAMRGRGRAEAAAWCIYDKVWLLRRYYTDALQRVQRLQWSIGGRLLRATEAEEREAGWQLLSQLASPSTFFFAAFDFLNRSDAAMLARFVMAAPAERRTVILGERCDGKVRLQGT